MMDFPTPKYFAQLCIDTGTGYSKEQAILKEISGTKHQLDFDLRKYPTIKKLHFNPLNTMVVLRLEQIKIMTAENTRYDEIPYTTNAVCQQDNLLLFETNDPRIDIDMNNIDNPKTLILKLEYIARGTEVYRYLAKEQADLIACQDEKIRRHLRTIQQQEQTLQQQKQQILHLLRMIRAIKNTLSWKITEPLRRMDRFLSPQTLPLSKVLLRIGKRLIGATGVVKSLTETENIGIDKKEIVDLRQAILLNRKRYLATNPIKHNKVALYTNSSGNYFFYEITELIAGGFRELGFEVGLRNELDGFADHVDWHVIIAPHEFFYIGKGGSLQKKKWPFNTILINTEQPSTSWFTLLYECLPKAYALWDINYQSACRLADMCEFSYYLPPGYVPEFKLFQEVKQLPYNDNTCFLETEISKRSYFHRPLSERPIDICFIGHASERRQAFLAKHAAFLSKYRCYLYTPNLTGPMISGKTTNMDTETVIGLEQRSKIILNIHHGRDIYFEWHRIVMHGIWQKALVISEPCSPAPPFEPNVDFVVAELDDIPEKIEYYLSNESGQQEAQRMTEHAFKTLTDTCKIVDFLDPLVSSLYHTFPEPLSQHPDLSG